MLYVCMVSLVGAVLGHNSISSKNRRCLGLSSCEFGGRGLARLGLGWNGVGRDEMGGFYGCLEGRGVGLARQCRVIEAVEEKREKSENTNIKAPQTGGASHCFRATAARWMCGPKIAVLFIVSSIWISILKHVAVGVIGSVIGNHETKRGKMLYRLPLPFAIHHGAWCPCV